MTSEPELQSCALDLGSTRVKCAALNDGGSLVNISWRAAPELHGSGLIRESDPEAWIALVDELLAEQAESDLPLGIASQRSSFLLWDRTTGKARTPLISWQDRRAQNWCASHRDFEPLMSERSGLRLSAHYAGPKLASMLAVDKNLAAGLADGRLLFGTLESWIVWRLSQDQAHETDVGMAARTGMLNIGTADWDPDLLSVYGVPASALPRVVPSRGRETPLKHGLRLTTTLADQAAGALAVMAADGSHALANFGTGAFVLWPGAAANQRQRGYLTAPLYLHNGDMPCAMEGTINGAGPSLDGCAPPPTILGRTDAAADAFALPDRAGIGAPHWRAGLGPLLSQSARRLPGAAQRRVMLEGLLFRVYEILQDLGADRRPARLLLAGGLTRDAALAEGLATLIGRSVYLPSEPEAGLMGAARLAAGLPAPAASAMQVIHASARGKYLREKYTAWREWLHQELAKPPKPDNSLP